MNTWNIEKTDFALKALETASSIFTISNGYLSIKGNLQENRAGRMPSTFLHGVFDKVDMISLLKLTKHERRYLDENYFDSAEPSPSIANLPNPLYFKIFVNNAEVSFYRGEITNFKQTLDMKTGLYVYEYDYKDKNNQTTRIQSERFADMTDIHQARVRVTITPLDYSGNMLVYSGVDGSIHSNMKHDKQFDVVDSFAKGEFCQLTAKTRDRCIEVNLVVINKTNSEGMPVTEDDKVYHAYHLKAEKGLPVVFERVIVMNSSEDNGQSYETAMSDEINRAKTIDFETAYARNTAWWRETWQQGDVEIEGDDTAQLYLRFCLYQILSAAPRHTDRLSVPCKLLTGEWYQGSVFYDTDLYILPYYQSVFPHIAKNCLTYRYNALENGKKIAKQFGYDGAKFAWQSGPFGEEVLGRWWRFTHTNIHINGDVCYALMQNWKTARDVDFMAEKGIDLLVESARFYASRAVVDPDGVTFHLNDVSGPDEGHCESNDNFYTNKLAKETINWALEILEVLRSEKPNAYLDAFKRLEINQNELSEWKKTADGLAFLLNPVTNIYEQYDGFYKLAPLPIDFFKGSQDWWKTVAPYQGIHQPDVVMAQMMFVEDYPQDELKANWGYYKEKSLNYSSMSHVINCIAGLGFGEMEYAYRQFIITAGEDLDESLTGRGDTADGIHGTASGGAWMAAVFGFGGVLITDDELKINPKLPENWKKLKFNLIRRGVKLEITVTQNQTEINASADSVEPTEVKVSVRGNSYSLTPGSRIAVS